MSSTLECLTDWMTRQRWYSGKGHVPKLRVLSSSEFPSSDPTAKIVTHLVMDDAGDVPTLYQVPVVERDTVPRGAGPYFIGRNDDGVYLFDGPHDPVYALALLLAVAPDVDGVTGSAVMKGEQSNTSIVYDIDGSPTIICKVFRALHHGENPDVTLQAALSTAGSPYVPRFVGFLSDDWEDVGQASGRAHGNLAFAQEFLSEVEDGWKLALRSAASGESFSALAGALGLATAGVHSTLAEVMPTREATAGDTVSIVSEWHSRLAIAAREVPSIEAHRAEIEAVYDAAQHVTWPRLQRIHGDLHLGQALWVVGRGWVLVDFEGEPLRPMYERDRPDSSLRDVSGMLRSFDYAAGATEGWPVEWAATCRAAFLEGYATASGIDLSTHQVLLDAFELDKAVYEAIYEARNRPTWIHIPVSGIENLLSRESSVSS